jgi:hypothetical protein
MQQPGPSRKREQRYQRYVEVKDTDLGIAPGLGTPSAGTELGEGSCAHGLVVRAGRGG